MAKRNYEINDLCLSMKKQMALIWKLCEKYPSMDFYRRHGKNKECCRITIMGTDIAEVWTEELARNKSIEPEFAGDVISNHITEEDRAKAIPVNEKDYSALKGKEFDRFAYQSNWTYKWIKFAQTYDDLLKLIEYVVLNYAKEKNVDLFTERGEYEREHYRTAIEEYIESNNRVGTLQGRNEGESDRIIQTAGRDSLGEFAPDFAHYNDDILFGENWNNTDLDLKTRSLITVVALMAQGITDSSLKYHIMNAKAHGVSQKEMAAAITHIAFYAGWPKAWAVFNLAKEVYDE